MDDRGNPSRPSSAIARKDAVPVDRLPGVLYLEHGVSFGGANVSLIQTVAHCEQTHPIVVTLRPIRELTSIHLPENATFITLRSFADYSRRGRWLEPIALRFGKKRLYWLASKSYALLDSANDWFLLRQLTAIVKRYRVGLIHCNNNVTLLSYRLARRTRLPLVYHFRGPDNYRQYPEAVAHASAYVSISSALTQLYSKQLGIAKERFTLIPDPVDLAPFETSENQDRATRLRQQTGCDDPVIVSITGRVMAFKGQMHVLNACLDLMERHPNLRLWIIGDGGDGSAAYLQELMRHASGSGHGGRVVFWGYQAHVVPFLLASDIIVNASVGLEGFGRSVAEGFAAGRAVISTAIGGPLDLVHHEGTGLLVAPNDAGELRAAIERLLTEPELRSRLARAGHDFCRRHLAGHKAAGSIEALQVKLMSSP